MAIIKEYGKAIELQVGDRIEYCWSSWNHVGTIKQIMDTGVMLTSYDFVAFKDITRRVV